MPLFEGPSNVEVLTEEYVREQIMKTSNSKNTIYVVEFAAKWSNKCVQFSEIYAQLSMQ
jgi:hypothetical protein